MIYETQGKKDAAIDMLEQEVASNPENYKFVLELAQLYMKYEMYDKAIVQLVKVTNLPPLSKVPQNVYEKIRGYLLLSRCYRILNKFESAEEAINLALQIDPADPELHLERGYVYYALQRDKESVESFEYYLKRQPAAANAEAIKGLINRMRIER